MIQKSAAAGFSDVGHTDQSAAAEAQAADAGQHERDTALTPVSAGSDRGLDQVEATHVRPREPAQLGGEVSRCASLFEDVIVCGSPETSLVRQWRPTMPLVADSHVFWYGDNLPVMREFIGDETVDLIYLDPPFNSQAVYNLCLPNADGTHPDAQRKAFADYWRWGREAELSYGEITLPGKRRQHVPATLSSTLQMFRGILHESNMLAYLSMMAVRLVEMRRVLKPTGSLYLHCDPTASHYLKMLLDALFEPRNFRGEIIWKRTQAHNSTVGYGPIHDALLFYSKSDEFTWNRGFQPYSDEYIQTKFKKVDKATGKRFRDVVLTGPGVRSGACGQPWRNFDPTAQGRHWQPASYVYWKYTQVTGDDLAKYPLLERLDRLDEVGLLYWTKGGKGQPNYKLYLEDAPGVPLQDIWTDIDPINSQANERTDYPTQKPVALLERIIRASSKEGDMILDPFCGCGTAVVAAQALGRRWIGIDITHVAVSVLKQRLEQEFPGLKYRVRGEPGDVASARKLADDKWEEFQAWIVDRVGGVPLNPTEEKKVAKKGKDHGIDGLLLFRDDPKAARSKRMILSVKAGKNLNPEMINALYGVMQREGAPLGALLTAYQPSKGVYNEAGAYRPYRSEVYQPNVAYPAIQVVTVEDIFTPGWRLQFPGMNTTRTSEPPAGTPGASEELPFKLPKKTTVLSVAEPSLADRPKISAPKPPKKTAAPSPPEAQRRRKT